MKSYVVATSLIVGNLWLTAAFAEEEKHFGLSPLTDTDFRNHNPAQVELGRNLFF